MRHDPPVFQAFEFFRLGTYHGGVLRARISDGALISDCLRGSEETREVTLARSMNCPFFGFLFSDGSNVLGLKAEHDPLRAPIVSFRLSRHHQSVVLRHPLSEMIATAPPVGNGPAQVVQVNRSDIGGWEMFSLMPCSAPELSELVAEALDSTGPVLTRRFHSKALVSWLGAADVPRLNAIGPALLRLAPPDALAHVGAFACSRPEIMDALAECLPRSGWSAGLLSDLSAWLQGRSYRPRIDVGPERDDVATAVLFGQRHADLAPHLLSAVRRAVEPRRQLAVLATARNEGPYFLDWIAHHRSLGVDHVFIYSSDDNDDHSDELLEALADAGVVTWLHNISGLSVTRQRKAYNHAFLCLPETLDFRWLATIDLDEYITLDPALFSSLSEFLDLQASRGADAVALNWQMFGSGGEPVYRDAPVSKRFTHREPKPNRHVKTIVRSNTAWGTLHHAPLWPDRVNALALDASGKPHYIPGAIGGTGAFRSESETGPAWISHFFLRSFPETVWKYARSSADEGGTHELRLTTHFVPGLLGNIGRSDMVEDKTILAGEASFQREREQLLSLPGVAAAHRRCIVSFAEKVSELVLDIPNHLEELPDRFRDDYLSFVARTVKAGIVRISKHFDSEPEKSDIS